MSLHHRLLVCALGGFVSCVAIANVQGGLIADGEAKLTIDLDGLAPFPGTFLFDRFYDRPETGTLSRNQMVSPVEPPSGPTSATNLPHPVNGIVTSPNPPGGGIRHRQSSTLAYDSGDPLGSWAPASYNGIQVSGGEQIGLDGVLRMTISPLLGGGTFVLGDFALRYAPTRPTMGSGLVLTNNFDFPDSPLFDIGNPTIQATSSLLMIEGDLLLAPEYVAFFGGIDGANVGTFRLTAAVPEPTSLWLVLSGGIGVFSACARRRLRARRPDHTATNAQSER